MNVKNLLLLLIALSLLVAGCSTTQEETTSNETPTENVETVETTMVEVAQQEEPIIVEEEVRLTKAGFFPQTFNVNEGETLRLVFLLDEAQFISIDALGIAEEVQTTTLDLTFATPGEYDMLCVDCEDTPVAVISVN